MQEQTPWHRLFGMMLTSIFEGSAFRVEYEKDLSFKAQRLDVVVIREEAEGTVPLLPDGLRDALVTHNLISFKSYRDTLTDWTLKELTGHYVNHRKQVSPSMNDLLPEDQFHLFALSAHYPQNLAAQVPLTEVQEGVYDCRRGTDLIRIVVLNRLPLDVQNCSLHLFSGEEERIGFGATNFFPRTDDISTMLMRVFEKYLAEGVKMQQTNEEWLRDYIRGHLKDLSPQERVKDLSPEERVKDLSPEERVKGLSPNELLQAMQPEVLEALRKSLDKATHKPDESTRQG
jgi:hypothetical protein